MDQEGSPCSHTLLTATPSYHGKMNLGGPLDTEKFAEAVLLYVFNTGFPAFLLITTVFADQPLTVVSGPIWTNLVPN